MCPLHIITMCVWKVVEPIGFVIVLLHFCEHALFGHALFHILAMLSLLASLLFLLNFPQFHLLFFVTRIFVPFIINLLNALVSGGRGLLLCLLHVLLHEATSIITCTFVQEQGALAFTKFLVQEIVECHLRQELILLQ